MLIERIEIFHVAMPLIYPWRTAYGEDASIESLLIKVSSEDQYGWGEATPFAAPCYSPEWAAGIFSMVNQWLAPALVKQEIPSSEFRKSSSGYGLVVIAFQTAGETTLSNPWRNS